MKIGRKLPLPVHKALLHRTTGELPNNRLTRSANDCVRSCAIAALVQNEATVDGIQRVPLK